MLFNSFIFMLFLPLVFLLHRILPKQMKWGLLLAAGYMFFGYANPSGLFFLMITTITTFFGGIQLNRSAHKHIWFTIPIMVNLGILFILKYFGFFEKTMIDLFPSLSNVMSPVHVGVLLPLGISFYTLQSIGYMMDVKRGDILPEKHLGFLALFLCFFPIVSSGPIERARNLIPQIRNPKQFQMSDLLEGLIFMAWGFFQKLVIAERLSTYVAAVFDSPVAKEGGYVLLGSVLFTFQLFLDFGGYSLIAMGVARLFGFRVMSNFNRPYFATSLRFFWSRWHISLTSWFRDYVYVPLHLAWGKGRKRISKTGVAVITLVVFLLSGLWHGTGLTYIFWGFLNGLGLVIEPYLVRLLEPVERWTMKKQWRQSVYTMIRVCVVFVFATLAFLFFRAPSLSQAFSMLVNLTHGWQLTKGYFLMLIIPFTLTNTSVNTLLFLMVMGGITFFVYLTQEWSRLANLRTYFQKTLWLKGVVLFLLTLSLLLFGQFDAKSFIYNQF